MHVCNHTKKRKSAGILLITVFSLLQLALWGPSFFHALHENKGAVTCQHDHALCGCSPSRIASKTCCCALDSISPCCQKNYLQAAREEQAAAGAMMTSRPCGGSEDPLVIASLEAYLLPAGIICDCPVSTTVYPLSSEMSQINHTISPPIPPPRV